MVSRDLVIRYVYVLVSTLVFNPVYILSLIYPTPPESMPLNLYMAFAAPAVALECIVGFVVTPYLLRVLNIANYRDALAYTTPSFLFLLLFGPVLNLYSLGIGASITSVSGAEILSEVYEILLLIAYWFILAYVSLVFARVHRAGGFSNRLVYYGALVMGLGMPIAYLLIAFYPYTRIIPANSPAYIPQFEAESVVTTALMMIGLVMFVIGHRRSRAAKVIEAVRQ
jgi:hypothetical protein